MVAIKTIGEVLKDKRTELGLGLSEAEKLTNIPKLYIIALETGDYKALPGDFYIKAYLKQYAEKLDLDADQIMLAYEKDGSMSVEEHEDIQETFTSVVEEPQKIDKKARNYFIAKVENLKGEITNVTVTSVFDVDKDGNAVLETKRDITAYSK